MIKKFPPMKVCKKSSEEQNDILKEAIAAAPKLEKDAAAQEKANHDVFWEKLLAKKQQMI